MILQPGHFADFFKILYGFEPYQWQTQLLTEILEGNQQTLWPTVIAAPTGAGKTAVLDIALFHLALTAERSPRPAPLRIVFAVDRRVIVDQAFERAQHIRKTLESSTDQVVAAVGNRLRQLSGTEEALHVELLRGGLPREDDWARTPTRPTILCTTVDQLGSRLLFRGYGSSPAMAPIHAGLLGQDALLILDEAHLSTAFAQTLTGVMRAQGRAETPLGLPFAVTNLTATPPATPREPKGWRFALTEDQRSEEAIAKRLKTSKLAELINTPERGPIDLNKVAARFIDPALTMQKNIGDTAVVAIVVNRVALARTIFEDIQKKLETIDTASKPDIILLTGRVRPLDRDRLIEQYRKRLEGDEEARQEAGKPLFVVATQAIEAGADFDFDGLVTQIAPLDALAQRFGRLARKGRSAAAPAAIIALQSDIAARSDDPIYGDRLRLTWEWLRNKTKDGKIDLGPNAIEALIAADKDGADQCQTQALDAPTLRPADIDFFRTTNPSPTPDPLLPLYLHGDAQISSDISLVWRADLTEDDLLEGRAAAIVDAVPPCPGEALQIGIAAARRWLETRPDPSLADVPQADEPADRTGIKRYALRLRGGAAEVLKPGDSDIRPGDTLVVPAKYGGCDKFGWAPDNQEPALDIAYEAASAARKKRIFRLHPYAPEAKKHFQSFTQTIQPLLATHAGRSNGKALINALPDLSEIEPELQNTLNDLKQTKLHLLWPYANTHDAPPIGVVIVAGLPEVESTDDDRSSFIATPQRLNEHAEHVAEQTKWAKTFLSPELAEALAYAALHHDDGKADKRFQAYLGADLSGNLLAKSGERRSRTENNQARKESGLPKSWRHEVLSVRLAADRFAKQPPNGLDLDLILWLIGTHHGQGRPFFNHQDPWDEVPRIVASQELPPGPGPHRLDFDWKGEDWAGLFDRLVRRYGPWGLAYLEAALRLADHRASEHRASEAAAPKAAQKPVEEKAE